MPINFPKKILIKISHLPTVLLMVGYLMFWIELYAIRGTFGSTSWITWLIFCGISIWTMFYQWRSLSQLFFEIKYWWGARKFIQKIFIILSSILMLSILLLVARASSMPPHLPQEYDSLNYHITIPRQHLIIGSFTHLPWSAADLFLLPLDFSMAPYCLSTPWPNKFAFYFFILGILGVSAQLVWRFSKRNTWACFAVILAILGSHGISIQFGIAMFDLIMLYLFLAAVDSFLSQNWWLAAVESSFYIWSKSFIPIQIFVLGIVLYVTYLILSKKGWKLFGGYQIHNTIKLKTFWAVFVISSFFIGGPFVAKSLYYTGTPLYPFAPGIVSSGVYKNTDIWPSVVECSAQWMQVKDQYGKGRGLRQLVEHFWILAVPEKSVNNRFDYPLGLPYLLVLMPFVLVFIENLRNRKINLTLWFCLWYWVFWWFGSQQARFFYIPLVIMFIVVLSDKRFLRKSMFFGIFIAFVFSCLSIVRAHKADFFRRPEEVLRGRDRELIEISKSVNHSKPVTVNFEDVAFANFAVHVDQPNSLFILKH
jgi:hypothetical protein